MLCIAYVTLIISCKPVLYCVAVSLYILYSMVLPLINITAVLLLWIVVICDCYDCRFHTIHEKAWI